MAESSHTAWSTTQILAWVGIAFLTAVMLTALAGDWIAGVSVFVLFAIWAVLLNVQGPPVLPLALTHQWFQVCAGVPYHAFTGRPLATMTACDYRTMMLVGLGCLVALLIGLWAGIRLVRSLSLPIGHRRLYAFTSEQLWWCYFASIPLSNLHAVPFLNIPQLGQFMIAFGYFHLGCFYLLCRRLLKPVLDWQLLALLVVGEVILNLAGFHATFREPLLIFMLVLIDDLDFKNWSGARITMFTMAILFIVGSGWIWTGFKEKFRERLRDNVEIQSSITRRYSLVADCMQDWIETSWDRKLNDLDHLVDRLWTIYYPALAVERVPAMVPHSNGEMMHDALVHIIMPRLFNPDKPALYSESRKVRKYSGVWVAGEEKEVNIAFGYAAESYVDFGLPIMFLPVLCFGLFMGMVYEGLFHIIWHRELAIMIVCVLFWLSLYSFERSWAKTLGQSITTLFVLSSIAILLDRFLMLYPAVRPRSA